MTMSTLFLFFFFFNDTATTEIYTLSLHDALPISWRQPSIDGMDVWRVDERTFRSEEHTSELQSRVDISYAVFCLKKKKTNEPTGTTRRDGVSASHSSKPRPH